MPTRAGGQRGLRPAHTHDVEDRIELTCVTLRTSPRLPAQPECGLLGRAPPAPDARCMLHVRVFKRLGIRLLAGLVGVAAGLLVCDVGLENLSISAAGLIEATLVFWVAHIVVQFLALKVLVRQPSIALAGLLALASTIIALFIAVAVVPGLSVHGAQTYVWATLIIWATTATADVFARRTVRDQRLEKRL